MAYSKCSICGVYLHLTANRGQSSGRTCFFDYHEYALFGLARADAGLSKTKNKDWNYPLLPKKRENASIINNMTMIYHDNKLNFVQILLSMTLNKILNYNTLFFNYFSVLSILIILFVSKLN